MRKRILKTLVNVQFKSAMEMLWKNAHSDTTMVTWLRVYKHGVTSSVYSLRDPSGLSVKGRILVFRFQMATDIERLASFEEAYYDQYDYYNLLEYSCHACGKGRTKREIELNTNRHCPAGHERKIAEKFHNSQMKRRRTKSSSSWWLASVFTGKHSVCVCVCALVWKQFSLRGKIKV